MAKKIIDFINDLAKTGGIVDPDLETALAASGLKDLELPDLFVTKVGEAFLTRERAKNDPAIVSEIQKSSNKSAFKTFDDKMDSFLTLIAEEDRQGIKETKETFEKYDLLLKALKKAQAAGKGKVNEDATKILEEKNAEIVALKKSHEIALAAQASEMENVTINGLLKGKILAKKFSDTFTDLRDSISDLVIGNVRKKYTAKMVNGEIKLLMPAGDSLVEAFEGNEKVTIDGLLEKECAKFIAVSNGKDKEKEDKKERPTPIDMSKLTLAERRQIAAAQP